MAGNDELVQVPVPKRHLGEVYGLIARLERGETVAPAAPEPEPPAALNGEWTPELTERMYAESPPAMKRVLKRLAQEPDQEVVSDKLTEALGPGKSWPNLAGTLGAFGRRVKNRYGKEWPFTARWDHDRNKVIYVMSRETADIINGM